MIKKLQVLLFLLVAGTIGASAYTSGYIVHLEGFALSILADDVFDVSVIGFDDTATDAGKHLKNGVLTIPETLDLEETHETFHIVQIGGMTVDQKQWSQSIKEVQVKAKVNTLDIYSFVSEQSALETIVLPSTLEVMANEALIYINKVKEIKFFTDETYTNTTNSNDYFYVEDNSIVFCRDVVRDDDNNIEYEGESMKHASTYTLKHVTLSTTFTNGKFEIPATVNGKAVANVTSYAIFSNKNLKQLVFPASITDISAAFSEGSDQLEAVEVLDGNNNYKSKDGVLYDYSSLTRTSSEILFYPPAKQGEEFSIPYDDVMKITKIASMTFVNSKFSKINLGKVVEIEEDGFYHCDKLVSVKIPETTTSLENGFNCCSAIEEYIVNGDNPTYYNGVNSESGVVYTKGTEKQLMLYPPAKKVSYKIDEGTTVIAKSAFNDAKMTELCFYDYNAEPGEDDIRVTIPESVQTIEVGAFSLCNSMTRIISGKANSDAAIEIKNLAFESCEKLETVELPATLTTLGGQAFSRCGSLTTVSFDDNSKLESIGESAFRACYQLESIDLTKTNSLTEIGNEAFRYLDKLNNVYLPGNVTTIGDNAFGGCMGMTSLTFAEDGKMKAIGAGAFADCGVENLVIPESITSIGYEAFRSCTNLKSVHLPQAFETIDERAFIYCSSLVDIDVDPLNENYSSVDGMLLTKDKKTLLIFPPGKANDKFTLLAPSIENIGKYSFYACENLQNVTIPNLVVSIGERAFSLCPNLNTVTFLCENMIDPANIAQDENRSAFDEPKYYADNLTAYVRTEKLSDYQNNSFYTTLFGGRIETSFTDNGSEYIPVSDNAVDMLKANSTDYTYILPSAVTNGGKDYTVSLIGDYSFNGLGGDVKEVVVFDNVEYIGAKAFMTDIDNNQSTVESIFFIHGNPTKEMLSTTRFALDDTGSDYSEIAASTTVYVKKSALNEYKTAFSRYVEDAYDNAGTTKVREATPDMFAYQVPFSTKGSVYGTLSREFAIDLDDPEDDGSNPMWNEAQNCPNVIAFTAGKKAKGKGDTQEAQEYEYHVSMTSINLGGEGDGTHIPANTGVLIKVIDSSKLPSGGLYYRIAETQDAAYTGDNLLTEVVVNGMVIDPNASDYDKNNPVYVMGEDNLLHAVKKNPFTLQPHEAFLMLPEEAAGAKLVISFATNDETTGIIGVSNDSPVADGFIYDLQGRRLQQPQKGIYIMNGKKVIIK